MQTVVSNMLKQGSAVSVSPAQNVALYKQLLEEGTGEFVGVKASSQAQKHF